MAQTQSILENFAQPKKAEPAPAKKEEPKKSASKKHHSGKTLLQTKGKFAGDLDDDIIGAEQAEDKEIMKSIEYAERKLNAKMATPQKIE